MDLTKNLNGFMLTRKVKVKYLKDVSEAGGRPGVILGLGEWSFLSGPVE